MEVNGWKTDLNNLTWEQLPADFTDYVRLIEQMSGVKISLISTGVDRGQVVRREICYGINNNGNINRCRR
jgi:adenylosuccinate synthase